ncbi:uncharacterized protein B0T15DRAFT_528734 [Chaetomium strumarium]|uniref:Uncharacterized protein n=1 Tax=Chaetomium strumarium TaxID=1170767 RepID=A0AAJ0M2T2_9PEZI|nr:hypothetical protein B0T15DRAFT_528734 [Chaetomium strumarium]
MLERTATSIEPCSSSLQRVLPSARSCLQSRRKLHTTFWHHGAAEMELIDACQALMRMPPAQPTSHAPPTKPNKPPETMTASGFLLDFLYPTGTAALLRKPYLIHPVRLDPRPRTSSRMSRLFTSAVSRHSDNPSTSHAAARESGSLGEAEEHDVGKQRYHEYDFEDEDGDEGGGEEGAEEGAEEEVGFADPEALRKLLYSDHAGAYDQIFQLYANLDPSLKDDFTTDVLLAIAPSTRPIEAWRVNDLFAHYRVDEWTEDIVRAAVKARLSLHNVPEAMSIFRTAMEQRGFGRALDYILSYGFELSSWDLILEAWQLYFSIKGESEPVFQPPSQTTTQPDVEATDAPGLEEVVESEQLEDVEPDATPVAAAELQPSAEPKAAEPDAESAQLQNVESVVAPSTEQTAKSMPESTAVAALKPGQEPASSQDTQFAVESGVVQDAGAISPADSAVEDSPESPVNHEAATTRSTGLGISYPTLAATENFEVKVRELYKFLENDPERLDKRTALVDSFLKHIVRHSLDLFRPSDVIFMLDRARDPLSYERYIILNAEQGRNRLASDLYKKYRALPNKARVAESVLRVMIDIFFPHNVHGMELLLEDWYRDYGRLNERAYHKFMAFYAGRGDIKSIMRLVKEYAKHYDVEVEKDPKWVANLMHAHAVRGDPEAARHVMDSAVERSGEPPEVKQWNILLNAYAKAGDYEGAIDLFAHICNECEPDDYTFATMMHMAGFRGDLQFTLELFQLARERNIEPNVAMMRALAEAYCQNDRHAEAEKLCVQLTKRREIAGDYTFLWNGLLRHNARRRDLTTVNRLLELMSSLGIAYNQETYSQLILALLYARQSHHAMHLLRVAHREGVFEPTADHYVMLMAAFINSGEPHMALRTNELMAKMNYPESAMRMTKVIDALGRWQQLPSSKRRGLRGQHFLKRILRGFYEAMKREEQGAPDDVRSVVGLYSKVIFILTQMREFATVQQIVQLHNSRYPSRGTEETIPLKLLHSVMLADFYEKKYDRVKQTWELILERSSERYQPASAHLGAEDPTAPRKPVIYAQRFRLCNPLKTMQRLYLQTEDPEGLMNLVSTVRERGFDLDSKNWNYHVQGLARLKQWRQAFTVCEEVLMPQWMGWYAVRAEAKEKNQLPLELRRAGTNPARPRPIAHTLLILAKEYMDLEQMALWSHEANREFKFITENCPKTVHAVTSMVRSGSPLEAEILGEERREESDVMDTDLDGRWHAEKVQGRETEELRARGGGRPGKLVRQATPKWARSARRTEQENVPYDDVWTQGGYLNVGDPAAQKKKGSQAELSEEDILRRLKGEGEK